LLIQDAETYPSTTKEFMKKQYFNIMLELMDKNPDVYLLFVGLGYPRVDEFLQKYPDRAFNTEASEQTALDIAVGLAYEGKIVFVYTITPFLLRGFETIRTYINHESLRVILVGAGRDDDYGKHDGFSHDAQDIEEILKTQHSIFQWYPNDEQELKRSIDASIAIKGPNFISLRR